MNQGRRPGQGFGNRPVTFVPEVVTDNGGTKYSPGLVFQVPVRRYDRAGTDWRITSDGSGAFVSVPDVPSDSDSYLQYLETQDNRGRTKYQKDFGAVSYGRPRSGNTTRK